MEIDEKLTIKDRKAAVMAESERPFHDPFQFGSMTTAVIKDGRNDR